MQSPVVYIFSHTIKAQGYFFHVISEPTKGYLGDVAPAQYSSYQWFRVSAAMFKLALWFSDFRFFGFTDFTRRKSQIEQRQHFPGCAWDDLNSVHRWLSFLAFISVLTRTLPPHWLCSVSDYVLIKDWRSTSWLQLRNLHNQLPYA